MESIFFLFWNRGRRFALSINYKEPVQFLEKKKQDENLQQKNQAYNNSKPTYIDNKAQQRPKQQHKRPQSDTNEQSKHDTPTSLRQRHDMTLESPINQPRIQNR
jgi:hypothetical protein